jgi:hypothetical protein
LGVCPLDVSIPFFVQGSLLENSRPPFLCSVSVVTLTIPPYYEPRFVCVPFGLANAIGCSLDHICLKEFFFRIRFCKSIQLSAAAMSNNAPSELSLFVEKFIIRSIYTSQHRFTPGGDSVPCAIFLGYVSTSLGADLVLGAFAVISRLLTAFCLCWL